MDGPLTSTYPTASSLGVSRAGLSFATVAGTESAASQGAPSGSLNPTLEEMTEKSGLPPELAGVRKRGMVWITGIDWGGPFFTVRFCR